MAQVVMEPSKANHDEPAAKRCYTCGEHRHLGDFHRDKSRQDGLQGQCRFCKIIYMKRNAGLGNFKENSDLMAGAIDYLKGHAS